MLNLLSNFFPRKPIFTRSAQTCVMRLVFFPMLALSLLGAWLLPGGRGSEAWTGPVVLNRAPPPPSDAGYRQAFAEAWAPLPRAANPQVPVHLAPVGPSYPPAASYSRLESNQTHRPQSLHDEEAQLRAVINADIDRMKAMGIGVPHPEAQEPSHS